MGFYFKDFRNIVEKIAPKDLKQDYDNVGFLVGDSSFEINNIFVTLDVTLESIKLAKENNCNMIFSHHPLIFRKISNVVSDDLEQKKIINLIRENITLYCAHTNLDSTESGLNEMFADSYEIYKKEKLEKCENGIGFIGYINETKVEDIIQKTKEMYKIKTLRYIGEKNKKISKIAFVNGSGGSYVYNAMNEKVDLLITGDVTYHEAMYAKENGLSVIDAGHFEIENVLFLEFSRKLEKILNENGFENKFIYGEEISPYLYV